MIKELINLTQYADALRSTGYKNIESAISEIVDNSVEANATEIFIILKETLDGSKGTKSISEIAFLDNGDGMEIEKLQSALRIGSGTRVERKGIGRFGVGLPQASMHVAPRLEVYSWQNYAEKPYKAFLDIDKVKSGEQIGIDLPVEVNFPSEYKNMLSYKFEDGEIASFKKSGTFVLWKDCDNVSPKKASTLISKLEFSLGQKFRYFINQKKCKIVIVDLDNTASPFVIKPNDPLMLMNENLVMGSIENPLAEPDIYSHTEAVFEPFIDKNNFLENGIGTLEYRYINPYTKQLDKSTIKIKCSIVKEEFYGLDFVAAAKNPGETFIGKHVKKVEGISVVRAGREVDFGRFDFYSAVNEPFHRWWGIEIEFNTELDEVFGVSNNKQHVELISLSDEDYNEEEIKPIWIELKPILNDLIDQMKKRNKSLRGNARTISKNEKNNSMREAVSKKIINMDSLCEVKSQSNNIKESNPEKVKVNAEMFLKDRNIEVNEISLHEVLSSKVNFSYKAIDNTGMLFNFDISTGIPVCVVNTNHIFYTKFINECEKNPMLINSFELLLGALLRVKDTINNEENRVFDQIVVDWNKKITTYMNTFISM